MSIRIEYPFWFILLCLLLGAAITFILYYRNRRDELPKWLGRLLAVLRFVSVSLISFLLLSPLVRSVHRTFEKPVVVVALDNSQSVRMGKDSIYYQTEYRRQVNELINSLEKDYDTRIYTSGDRLKSIDDPSAEFLTFSEKQTDLAALFDEVESSYSNRNLGAIILASDGIFNHGMNPLYSAQKITAPLYTIALGDTSIQRDVILKRVNYNRIAYLGNKFPVEIVVSADKFAGQRTKMTLTRGDSVLFTKNIDIQGDLFTERYVAEVFAGQTGLVRYRASLSGLDDEISYENNSYDFFVEILDSRQKILILHQAPHPDVSAIKSAIQTNFNYEVEDFPVQMFQGELTGYNLVILHQIPARSQNQPAILAKINASNVPVLCILTEQTDFQVLNQLNLGMTVQPAGDMVNEATPAMNPDFMLFRYDDDTKAQLEKFPPLVSPFGEYRLPPTADMMLYQQVGKVISALPLIVFTGTVERKTGFITGEGIWKWRLFDYAENDNHNAFNQLILKTVQYLAVKDEKGFFRVIARSSYRENEPVELEAEVYDKSYEPVNDPDVEITIENDEGTVFPYMFGRKGSAYHLQAGNFPPGDYSYRAKVKVGSDLYEKAGQFSVEAVNIETVATRADHGLLYNLAQRHDGNMIFPDQMSGLPAMLKERDDIHTLVYTRKTYNEFNNIIGILAAIVVLLSTEWFLRKYKGSY